MEAFEILYNRLDLADPYTQTYGTLVEKKEFYAPEPLEITEIYVYRKRMQRPEECAKIHGNPVEIIVKLQIWRLFTNRVEKPICESKKLKNPIKIVGNPELYKRIYLKNRVRHGISGKRGEQAEGGKSDGTTVNFVGTGAKQKKTSRAKEKGERAAIKERGKNYRR